MPPRRYLEVLELNYMRVSYRLEDFYLCEQVVRRCLV